MPDSVEASESPQPFFFLRLWSSLRPFCLGVTGFTNPPIGEALAFDAFHKLLHAHSVGEAKGGAAIVAEIEFGKVTVQVGFAAMLIDADHAALENREHVLDGVGVDQGIAFEARIFPHGFATIRFWNDEVLKNIDGVCLTILHEAQGR